MSGRIPRLALVLAVVGLLASAGTLIVVFAGAERPHRTPWVVAVLKTIDVNMEFWEVVKSGMTQAAKESGVDLMITGPWAESDVAGQIRIVEGVLDSKPDALILSATDYNALVPCVERAKALGVPVVTIDSGVNSDYPRSFVATNNIEAGYKAGKEMMRRLKGGAKVLVINHIRGATTAMEREKGALMAFQEDGRYQVLGVRYTDNFEANACAFAARAVQEHPDLGGIVALNEVSTVGAARGLAESGAAGKVELVGFDNSIHEISLIESGVIGATVIQEPFKMGYLTLKAVKDVLDGNPTDRFIDTGSLLITPDTIYLPENQKIVFPFIDSKYQR